MKIYKLECLTEDGNIEVNGYFFNIENAEKKKDEIDQYPMNTRYGIKQSIIEIDTKDELSNLMPSDEEAMKIILPELRKCFNMGLRQSPTDAENSEFYAPYIELTIAPKLWKGLKQSQPK